MLMGILFGADGLSQLKGNVVKFAVFFQPHLTRLVMFYHNHLTKTDGLASYV